MSFVTDPRRLRSQGRKPVPWLYPDLRRRDASLTELMDDPGADPVLLRQTYRRFEAMNPLVSGWRAAYTREIRPYLKLGCPNTLLDVGCGGGDVARALARWARADGRTLNITGIDQDDRAIAFASGTSCPGVEYRHATSSELVEQGQRFDFVVSNHVLHHLDAVDLPRFLETSLNLATVKVLHNDIERHPLAYMGFRMFVAPLFGGTMIPVDGLRSVQRSYTPAELSQFAAKGWAVRRHLPYRLWMIAEIPTYQLDL